MSETKKKHPRKIGSIVNQLLARRGYAQVQGSDEMQGVFKKVLGSALASQCTVGQLKRGTLHVSVKNSVAVQELAFQKRQLIKALRTQYPQNGIEDIRFNVG